MIASTGLNVAGLRSEFLNRFEATPTYYGDWAMRVDSGKSSEDYRWLGTVPQVREWGTGRLAKGLRVESYSVEKIGRASCRERV